MNDKTAALLQTLADKLGTTSQYLWGVLIKQAPISGTIVLVEYLMTILVLVAIWKFRVPLNKWFREGASDYDFLFFIGSIICGVIAVFWFVACIVMFEGMVTAFLNPEYWALDHILSTLKSK